jgi:hypothetical protein
MPDINPVKVKKDELLEILRANRDEHGERYQKARRGYRKAVEAELRIMLSKVMDGEVVGVALANIPPEDHTGDYDDVIDMLGMDTDDTVILSQAQFRCYVKDNWGWKQQWITSNSEYIQS